jgi:hypothetical protein
MLLTSTKALIDHRYLTTLMVVELILVIELKLAIEVLIMAIEVFMGIEVMLLAIEVAKMEPKLSKNLIEI